MGIDKKCLYCNTDSYIQDYNVTLSETVYQRMEIFVKFDSIDDEYICEFKENGGSFNQKMVIYFSGGNTINWKFRSAGGVVTAVTTQTGSWTPSAGTWYHMVITYNASTTDFEIWIGTIGSTFTSGYTKIAFIDAGADTQFAALATAGINDSMCLGADYNDSAGKKLDGKLADCRVFSSVPSDADTTTYNSTFYAESGVSGALHYWKLNDASGTTNATDFWGAADDAAYTDGATGEVGNADSPFPTAAAGNPHYYYRLLQKRKGR